MNVNRRDLEKSAARLKAQLARADKIQQRLAAVSQEFRQRYRTWCLVECEAEWASDFLLLRTVGGSMVGEDLVPVFLEYLETIKRTERKELVIALCKRLHSPGTLSQREQQMIERYHQSRIVLSIEGGQPVTSTRVPLRQLQQRDRFFQSNPGKQVIRKLLLENLKNMTGRDFGRLIVNRPSVLTYEKQIGMWSLITAFELGGHAQLRYLHVVHALPGGKMGTNISTGISILNWTGILAETTWSWILPDDIPAAVQAVRDVCFHFYQHAENLLSGLKHDLV